jgi:hypothetical protein
LTVWSVSASILRKTGHSTKYMTDFSVLDGFPSSVKIEPTKHSYQELLVW